MCSNLGREGHNPPLRCVGPARSRNGRLTIESGAGSALLGSKEHKKEQYLCTAEVFTLAANWIGSAQEIAQYLELLETSGEHFKVRSKKDTLCSLMRRVTMLSPSGEMGEGLLLCTSY